MENITEEMQVHLKWYELAKTQTLDTLPAFLDALMNDYAHDYGTICHALAAGSIATATAMNNHSGGGITGFQGGAVMWEFIRYWNYESNKCGLKIVDYDNMLYPQYEDKYQKTISKETFEALQAEAAKNIAAADAEFDAYQPKHDKWKDEISTFIGRNPEYLTNPDKFTRLGFATGYEHEAQAKAVKNGLELAPDEPMKPHLKGNAVYKHWESIVAGKVPFGYKISDR